MPRWKLTLEYDGTGFLGWQRQNVGRTVQGELEQALETFFRIPISVSGQGRTDRGVHARGQTAHVDIPEGVTPRACMAAMRGLLPQDLAVIQVEPVGGDFHARFDAISRKYHYYLSPVPTPLDRKICWVVPDAELEMLSRCASMLPGTHDFRNFAKESGDENHLECNIIYSAWSRQGPRLCYTIEANRFLRHMVRRLVGTMVQVAQGQRTLEEYQSLLEAKPAAVKGHSAPARGLILQQVRYK